MRPCSCFTLLLLLFTGCQSSLDLGTNPEPVDITGTVSKGDAPITGLRLNLQPLESGLPATIDIKDGKVSARVTPGTYTWYLSGDEKDLVAKGIPEGFLAGSMERTVEIKGGDQLNLKVE
ncbi:MAG: hypothetical protein ACKO2P_17310 [Planctomycetota bacterium]